jgi:hypothetical protein
MTITNKPSNDMEIIRHAIPPSPEGEIGYNHKGDLIAMEKAGEGYSSYTYIHDSRSHICVICQKGWENTFKSMLDVEVAFEEYDHNNDGSLLESSRKPYYMHSTCYLGYLHLRERSIWYGIFCSFNKKFQIKETNNRYGGGYATPWYEIKIEGLDFLVGRRKRVYSIEVRGLKQDISSLFAEEKVTIAYHSDEDRFLIHAWSSEDAKRYISTIMNVVRKLS